MKKLILFLIALIASFNLSCYSCNNNPTLDAGIDSGTADIVLIKEQVITGSNWELVLPSQQWNKKETNRQNVELLAIDTSLANLVLFTKEPYNHSYDQFVIESLRTLRGESSFILKTSDIIISDIQFVQAETVKNDIHMILWVTVKDGFGYTLSCGGPEDTSDCQKIANTLVIK